MKKVTFSFKSTTKDMELYMRLMQEEEKSEVIKTALKMYYKSMEVKNNE